MTLDELLDYNLSARYGRLPSVSRSTGCKIRAPDPQTKRGDHFDLPFFIYSCWLQTLL
jgi:hypothetical protein